MPDLGKATYIIEIDERGSKKKMAEVRKDIRQTNKVNDDQLSKMAKSWSGLTLSVSKTSDEVDKNRESVDKNRKSLRQFGSDAIRLNQVLSLLGKTISVAKIPAFTAAIGYAVKAVAALAGGSVALVGALAPLSGLLVAYPALLGAAGQAMIAFKIGGVETLTKALMGSKSAMEKLSPTAKHLVATLKGMKPEWENLRKAVQKPMFEGFEKGLKKAHKNFGIFKSVMEGTGKAVGGVAQKFGELLGSKGFGARFEKVGAMNNKTIERMGNMLIKLVDALSHVMVAAEPFVNWLSRGAEKFGEWADAQAKAGQESGKMTKFFGKTKEVMETLWHTVKNLGEALFNIGKIGAPLGREMLHTFEQAAIHFNEWTDSAKGKNTIATYFKEIKGPLWEMGRLLHDVTISLFGLGKQSGLGEFLKALRLEVLPVLQEFFEETTKSFGPTLTKALVAIIKLAAVFAGTSGPLEVMVKVLTKLADAAKWVIDLSPVVKDVAVSLVGAAAIFKGIQFAGAITGVTRLIGYMRGLAGATETAAAAQGTLDIAGAGGVGGAGAAAGKGTVGKMLFGSALSGAAGGAISKIGTGGAARVAASGVGTTGLVLPVTLAVTQVAVGSKISKIKTGSSFGDTVKNILTAGPSALWNPTHIGPLKLPGISRIFGGGEPNDHHLLHEVNQRQRSEGFRGASKRSEGQFKGMESGLDATMARLRASAASGLGGINALFARSIKEIRNLYQPNSTKFGDAMHKSVNETVMQIKLGMAAGIIQTKKGKREIKHLLEEVHIKDGKDPVGIAEATVKSFKKAQMIAPGEVTKWLHKLDEMPRGARNTAMESINGMVKEWAKGHPKLEAQFDLLAKIERSRFGRTNAQVQKGTAEAMTNIAASAGEGAGAMAAALGNIGANLENALTALGAAKVPHFSLEQLSSAAAYHHERESKPHSGLKGAATGFLPGKGLHDHIPLMAAPGEAVVNRHQQGPINAALGFAKQAGLLPYGSLGDVFANIRTPHYMAQGGIAREVIHGGGAMGSGEQPSVDKVWKRASKYLAAHSEPERVLNMLAYARAQAAMGFPYVFGGGHGALGVGPFDCSGYVSGILGAGNFISSPLSVQQGSGLYTLGASGLGKYFTWGVRGTSGMDAHTMMSIKDPKGGLDYFEAGGSGGGAHEDSGWDGSFAYRHIPGFARGGHAKNGMWGKNSGKFRTGSGVGSSSVRGRAVPKKVQEQVNKYGQGVYDPHDSHFVGWGYNRGGFVKKMASGGVVKSVGSTLLRNGLDLIGAGGILGNSYGESSWNPSSEDGSGNGGLWGFTAHPVSLSDLQAYATAQGSPWTNAVTQTQFMLHHLSGGIKSQLNSAGSVADATSIFMHEWEKPLNYSSLPTRVEWGEKAYKILKGLGGAAPKSEGPGPKGIKLTPANSGGGVSAPEWATTEQIDIPGTVPKTVSGITHELEVRRLQLAKQKRALKKVKNKTARGNIEGNIKKLEDRIKLLIKERTKLVEENKRKKLISHAVGSEFMKNFSARLEAAQEKVAEATQTVNRFSVFEPTEEGPGLDKYRGEESGMWGNVLGQILGVRELEREGGSFAHHHIASLTAEIKAIKALKKSNPALYKKKKGLLPGLIAGRDSERAFEGERNSDLNTVQGYGGPRGPEWNALFGGLGEGGPNWLTLGGPGTEIFDTQNTIRELGIKSEGSGQSEAQSAMAELYKQQAEEATKRAIVSETLNPIFQEFFAHVPKYGGTFHSGGIVPGRLGEERTIIAQGGEIYAQPGTMATGNSTSEHHHATIIEDGAIDTSKIREVWGDEARKVVSTSRRRVGSR